MATFKVSSSGCTTGTFTLSEVTVESVSKELAKLGILDISDKQLQSIVEHGHGASFKFCRKARKALPVATVKDITEELKFNKALDIVNDYNKRKFELLTKVSVETLISITKKVECVATKYDIQR